MKFYMSIPTLKYQRLYLCLLNARWRFHIVCDIVPIIFILKKHKCCGFTSAVVRHSCNLFRSARIGPNNSIFMLERLLVLGSG
jgi:hypothetical protein